MQDFLDNSVKKSCFYDYFKYFKKILEKLYFFADVNLMRRMPRVPRSEDAFAFLFDLLFYYAQKCEFCQ